MNRVIARIGLSPAYVVIALLVCFTGVDSAHAQGANTRYVNINAPAGGNGTSWATAYNNLKTALIAVQSNPAVTQIWVAEGTYYPGTTRFNLRNNLALYGGFLGNETQLAQRNITLHETILTGQGTHGILAGGTTNATAVVDGFTLRDGFAGLGGAVADGRPTFRSCRFIGNRATYGGAVGAGEGTPTFDQCVFIGNTAIEAGGAIRASSGSVTVSGCVFEGNTAGASGGAIQLDNGVLTVNGCEFVANACVGTGSGTSLLGSRGGAVYTYQGTVSLTDSEFRLNAVEEGYFGNVGDGGAVYAYQATLAITHCEFRNNTAGGISGIGLPAGQGGAVSAYSGTAVVVDSLFHANVGFRGAGALEKYNGAIEVRRCEFVGNETGGEGAAISAHQAALTVIDCDFSENRSTNALGISGGGTINGGGSVRLVGSRIVGSEGGQAAVANMLQAGTLTMTNSLIAGNSPAGVYTPYAPTVVESSTIAGNSGVNLIAALAPPFTIRNSIIWGGGIAGSFNATYSCLPVTAPGVGNVSADPRFFDPADGDWRVQGDSPTIDAADATLLPADVFDLDGDGNTVEPLPIDGAGFARRRDEKAAPDTGPGPAPVLDMGAFEYFADCNSNGVIDAIDIASGTSTDLNGNGKPDDCEDCNGNQVPDSIDIRKGTSSDCDADGTPDDCELAAGGSTEYRFDDGTANEEIGNQAIGNMIWLNAFQVEPGAEVLRSVAVAFGSGIPSGAQALLHVWTDPTEDGNPADAVRRITMPVQAVAPGTNQFTSFDIPDIAIGRPGTWFFVGVQTTDLPNPAPLDRSSTVQRSWIAAATNLAPADPDDLGAAGRFGVIDSYNKIGNWLIRATADGGPDCNGNGLLDSCEVAAGTLTDCNANGLADECELALNDCNGNGVPDDCDIASGLEGDCQPNGIPDGCEIKSGADSDVDSNGVPDGCEDCNGNGIPDGIDIQGGLSEDCQPDGTPDECQLPSELLEVYAHDDGTPEFYFSPGGPPNAIWLNHFTVEEGKERVIALDVMYGLIAAGRPHTVYLWSDPNGDRNPDDARLLASVETIAEAVGSAETFTRVDIADVVIGPPGTGFFVGLGSTGLANNDFAAAKASGAPIYRSWYISSNGPIDPNDLSANAAEFSRMDDLGGPFIGSWCVRALAEAISDCNANNQPDDCDISDGTSLDLNGNGRPDECEGCLFDLDGDGAVGAGDLSLVLSEWGGASKVADLDNDGDVDAEDLIRVLNAWGPCR